MRFLIVYESLFIRSASPSLEMLERQKMPPRLVNEGTWDERLADIAHFENYVARQGTKILKFFLYVSREEQKKRFIERLDEPEKIWTSIWMPKSPSGDFRLGCRVF